MRWNKLASRIWSFLKLTWVLWVQQSILCVFVLLPSQGQMSFHRLHSSSMHISVCKWNTQEITVLNMKQQLHYLTEQKVKQQRYMKGWQCGTEWGPIWPSAYNTHTNTRTRTHTQSLCWKHKLIQSRRNEWKWSRGRDSIISLRWHSSPQRGWNESTALRL